VVGGRQGAGHVAGAQQPEDQGRRHGAMVPDLLETGHIRGVRKLACLIILEVLGELGDLDGLVRFLRVEDLREQEQRMQHRRAERVLVHGRGQAQAHLFERLAVLAGGVQSDRQVEPVRAFGGVVLSDCGSRRRKRVGRTAEPEERGRPDRGHRPGHGSRSLPRSVTAGRRYALGGGQGLLIPAEIVVYPGAIEPEAGELVVRVARHTMAGAGAPGFVLQYCLCVLQEFVGLLERGPVPDRQQGSGLRIEGLGEPFPVHRVAVPPQQLTRCEDPIRLGVLPGSRAGR
jgi:hypothetical protein